MSPVASRAVDRTSPASVPKRRTSRAGAVDAAQLLGGAGAQQRQVGGAAGAGLEPTVGDQGVEGVLGHPAVGRQLAADDRGDAGGGGEDRVTARQVGGRVGAGDLEQRSQAGEGADHVVAARRRREGRGHHPQQEVDLGLARHRHVRHRAGDRLVGQPDVEGAVGLRQHHREARGGAGDRHHHRDPGVRQDRSTQDQVGAAARPQPHLVVEVAGPDPGRVDDRLRADGVRLAGELVPQLARGSRSQRSPGRACAPRRRRTLRCGPRWSPGARRPRAARPRRAARRAGCRRAGRARG